MKKIKIITGFTRHITPSAIIGAIILLGIISAVYFVFIKKENKAYSLAKVSRGTITQEISETGTVRMGEEVNISFKSSGKIEKIYVKVGDSASRGQDLVKLDASQLSLQLAESESALGVAQAKMADAQLSLENAERDLNNIKEKADKDLNNAYEDALAGLDDACLAISNTFDAVYSFQKKYFSGVFGVEEWGFKVKEEKESISAALDKINNLTDGVKSEPQQEKIDLGLIDAKKILTDASDSLEDIRDIAQVIVYRDIVSATDKESLNTQKSNINDLIKDIVDLQQNIATIKTDNKINMSTAEAKVSTLRAQLQPEGLYQTQINQTQAQVSLLKKQIEEITLYSPVDGKVTKVKKEKGETAQAAEAVITLLPSVPFQIKADIYEEDIVKMKVDNPVDIKLPSFPDKILKGRVILIDPAEKLVEGVVYYEVTIDFEEILPEIKPGMSADVAIKVLSKDNVLMIPEAAVEKKDNKELVKVRKGKELQEQEVKTGAKGDDGMVEVISGLNEGEEILIK